MHHLHHFHLFDIVGVGCPESRETVTGITIFAFFAFVIAIRSYMRLQRQRMWHETVRSALEKGHPLPPNFVAGSWRYASWYQGGWAAYRGLIWIAIGVGLYLVNHRSSREWAPLPICIGVALLLVGLINLARKGPPDDTKNPSDRM